MWWLYSNQLSHRDPRLCNLPGMAFHVYCLVIPDDRPEYFIHQESSLPAKCLQQGQKLLNIAGLPLLIPSTRNHLILLHGVFNMARILLGNYGPPLTILSTSNHNFLCHAPFNRASIMLDIASFTLTISSTRNHYFHVYGAIIVLVIAGLSLTIQSIWNHLFLLQHVFTMAMVLLGVVVLLLTIPSTRNHLFLVYGAKIMLVIAGLPLTTPSIRNFFCYSTASTGQVSVGCCRPPSDYSIQQESSLSPA